MPRMLGRRPHDPDRPVLRLAHYLGQAPAHAPFADYLERVTDWGMYANDQFGVCGPTAVANQYKQVTEYLTGREVSVGQADVFDLYRRSGNPDFDPATGADDNGVVMADMLSALLKGGIGGHAPLAYAAVDVADPEEVRAAIGLFGSVLFGVTLDTAQETQIQHGKPWDYVRRSPEWGGHAVLAGAYTGRVERGQVDVSVVTWAEPQGCTDDFLARQLDEAYVVIWPELLGTEEFDQSVNLSALAADYQAMTGRPFPSLPPSPPSPTPRPTPPAPVGDDFTDQLRAFIAGAQNWLDTQTGA